MAFPEVPVMTILKEFREVAGPRGRKAHRPAPIPTYDYEKHRSGTVKLDLELHEYVSCCYVGLPAWPSNFVTHYYISFSTFVVFIFPFSSNCHKVVYATVLRVI